MAREMCEGEEKRQIAREKSEGVMCLCKKKKGY